MKAKEGVLDFLYKVVTLELTAVHHYLLHASMCDNWGYQRLHHEFHERMTEQSQMLLAAGVQQQVVAADFFRTQRPVRAHRCDG